MLIFNLAYMEDSARYFNVVRQEPWAMFLDSGQPVSQYGRFDIIVARPFATLISEQHDGKIQTTFSKNGCSETSHSDPFAILNRAMLSYAFSNSEQEDNALPFIGGAMGYFGYELGRSIEDMPRIAKANAAIPAMMVGLFDWAVVVDHRLKTTKLASRGLDQSTVGQWPLLCTLFSQVFDDTAHAAKTVHAQNDSVCEFGLSSEVLSNMSYTQYEAAFNEVKALIKAGDCYQVNLAQRFSAKAYGDAWPAYQQLRAMSPAPFMAFMHLDSIQVLSGSPERFLQIQDKHVETRPIKGTRPRSLDPLEDIALAEALQSSLKDRAENVMIVDLLRNDIGKNCEIGSVKADVLFQLQSFANVHHLVSIVTGTLAANKTAIDLLRGAFPGGSITGAPKLRSMQIIESLEPHQRAIYCGAIGYIDFNGNMDTNIAIRTAVYVKPTENTAGEVSFYAGGGIVADSVLMKEYTETLDKASSLLNTMQTFQKQSLT